MRKNYFLLLSICIFSGSLFGQNRLSVVDNYLKNDAVKKGEVTSNFEYEVLTDNKSINDAEYVRIQQTINGIPVYEKFGSFSLKSGQIINFNNNFIDGNLGNQSNVTPSLTPEDALKKYASANGKTFIKVNLPSDIGNVKEDVVLFTDKTPNYLIYFYDGKDLKLAWRTLAEIKGKKNDAIAFDPNHLSEVIIDANTGEVLARKNVITACSFHSTETKENLNYFVNPVEDYVWIKNEFAATNSTNSNGTYRVIPATSQSPITHSFDLLTNQADANASLEGWHKLIPTSSPNTALTANHTIGNNSHVGSDYEGKFSDVVLSFSLFLILADMYIENQANGGDTLTFDFPNPGNATNYNPFDYLDAATTQMFYSTNYIHDVLHYHGFTPQDGSFQKNIGEQANLFGFTTSGIGVEQQYRNNAFMGYSTLLIPNPTTMFFTFLTSSGPILSLETGELAGNYLGGFGSNTGFNYGVQPGVTGEFVLLQDQDTTGDIYDGCDPITNGSNLTGKIVAVNRGTCTFAAKVNNIKQYNPAGIAMLNVQVTDINNQFNTDDVANGHDNSDLTYPIIMLNKNIADPIREKLINNETFTATIPSPSFTMNNVDSSFDSQVILHEYVHAVSKRITNDAIGGEEGMGEGWSDYVALNLTQDVNHIGTDLINMGSYAFGGAGLRELPYTTDFNVNPHTYDHLKTIGSGDLPHPTGYVWALMLWEMHWNLIEKYGFNPDVKGSTGGNNIALNLVIEGLKLQVPNPGFVDGRNAILQADQAIYNGENQCEIWRGFAKRGLGFSAQQGTSESRTDGTEAFDLPAQCEDLAVNDVKKLDIAIYPNPTKDAVYIQSKDAIKKAEILDFTGRVVSVQDISRQTNKVVDTSILLKGVYVLKLYSDNGVISKKIIKN